MPSCGRDRTRKKEAYTKKGRKPAEVSFLHIIAVSVCQTETDGDLLHDELDDADGLTVCDACNVSTG